MRAAASARPRKSRGQSLAEFSLTIPIFLLVFLGIAEGGYYVAATTIVSHATREGARLGVLSTTPDVGAVQDRVKSAARPIVSIETDDIDVCVIGLVCPDDYGDREANDRLKVTTTYTHRLLVSYIFSAITLPAAETEAELRVEGAPSP